MNGLTKVLMSLALVAAALHAEAVAGEKMPNLVQQTKPPVPAIAWQSDYGVAMRRAEAEKKMLFIYFQPAAPDANSAQFEQVGLEDAAVRRQLSQMVCLRTSVDARIKVGDQEMRLVDHAAFDELERQAGAILLDFAHPEQEYYGYMVSALPFTPSKYYRFHPSHLAVMLDLPPGTITQRTLIFAVRIHPEAPASTQGTNLPMLAAEAGSHSHYQAQIRVQGHHFWEHRFHRITGLLPGGLRAREVCAESWPNEKLVDAAVDCVDCWRQSSGHWSAVRASHPHFGYDMKKGSNGIWYATGVFGTNQD
jgi:hypothetical protein